MPAAGPALLAAGRRIGFQERLKTASKNVSLVSASERLGKFQVRAQEFSRRIWELDSRIAGVLKTNALDEATGQVKGGGPGSHKQPGGYKQVCDKSE